MKKTIIAAMIVCMLFILYDFSLACENCAGSSDIDYCTIEIEQEDPANCILTFRVHSFWTCADGWDLDIIDIPPIFYVELPDECTGKYEVAWSTQNGDWRKYGQSFCGVICNPPGENCNCGCPPCCGVNDQFEVIYFVNLSGIHGHFRVRAQYKGSEIYNRWFNFNNWESPGQFLGFDNVELRDMSGHYLSSLATLDIDEPITVEVSADWSREPFEENIWGVFKSTGTTDSLLLLMNYVEGGPQNTIYSATASGGSIRQLFNDADYHFANDLREILTVYPQRLSCTPSKLPPAVNIYIGLYRFTVVRVTFKDDHPLCEETNSNPPTSVISDPEWEYSGRNKPTCYSMSDNIKMDVIITANHLPYHEIYITLQGIADVEHQFDTGIFSADYNGYEIFIPAFISSSQLPDTIASKILSYHWFVRVTPYRPPRYANTTGPHKVYIVYDTPINNQYASPTNTLGLNLVCDEYATGATIPDEILTGIMNGIYTCGGIYYDPERSAIEYPDPYSIYRSAVRIGQCNSFARFFLVLAHSVGLNAHKSVVYSGYQGATNTIFDYWANACKVPYQFRDLLWCKGLVDSQGHNGGFHGGYCAPYWNFNYHVMASYQIDSLKKSFDAVYNVMGNLTTEYGNWLKYYYTPREQHLEPPSDPPGVINYLDGENPVAVFNTDISPVYHDYLVHPISLSELIAEKADSITGNHKIISNNNVSAWRIDYQLGYNMFVNIERGDPFNYLSSLTTIEQGRRFNIKKPGDYLSTPLWSTSLGEYTNNATGAPIFIGANPLQDSMITSYVRDILKSEYIYSEINQNIHIYNNVLNDSSRTEFYGRFQIKDDKFTLGGWFNRFAVAGVICPYSGVELFLDQAHKYFVFPKIDRDKVNVKTEGDEYFYSVIDANSMFMLRGFKTRLVDPQNVDSSVKVNAIEFTKYYDREFVP